MVLSYRLLSHLYSYDCKYKEKKERRNTNLNKET